MPQHRRPLCYHYVQLSRCLSRCSMPTWTRPRAGEFIKPSTQLLRYGEILKSSRKLYIRPILRAWGNQSLHMKFVKHLKVHEDSQTLLLLVFCAFLCLHSKVCTQRLSCFNCVCLVVCPDGPCWWQRHEIKSSDAPPLVVPRMHTELARRSFSAAAPSTWNSVPADIRLCESILTFKFHLKTHLFKLT